MKKGKIEIIGLGAGDFEQMPIGIYRKLQASDKIYVRTKTHPVVCALIDEGIEFKTFDSIYEKHDDFLTVYDEITNVLIERAKSASKPIVYAVPGHPMIAEHTVQLLLKQDEIDIDILGGHSHLDAIFTALKIDPIEGLQFVDALSFQKEELNYFNHLLFSQVYDQFIASRVKLALLEDLPYDYPITIVKAAGTKDEQITKIPLVELDRMEGISNLITVYIPPATKEQMHHKFSTLRHVVKTLRGPEGCSWDKKQTHTSLRRYLIEEAYELIDAIDREDEAEIVEELGDVLFQVMLHSQIGEDNDSFTIDDVIKKITEKMIHRHPHVFSNEKIESLEDIETNWEKLKSEEKDKKKRTSIFDGIPKSSPALLRSYQIQKKAENNYFQWDHVDDVWAKLKEEINEFKEAVSLKDKARMKEELGDCLFTFVNIGIFYNINLEFALHLTNDKFINRFRYIEKKLKEIGKTPKTATFDQMNELWEEAKGSE